MASLLLLAVIVITVNVIALITLLLIAYVSGQDFLTVVPRVAARISELLSSRVRLEKVLLRKSQLEELVIFEDITHTGIERRPNAMSVCYRRSATI